VQTCTTLFVNEQSGLSCAHSESISPRADKAAAAPRLRARQIVHRVTFDTGAKWSNDLKPHAGMDSCLLPHVAYVQSGRLHVVMDDGSEDEFGLNDIMMLPPGHDAWAVGDEPCVFIEFSAGDYSTH
jgi:hypothetical protein